MAQIDNELLRCLQRASRPAVLTGAGVSAESGLSTFRDAQTGLWSKYRPEDLATPHAFERDPELVWRWYEWRRETLASVKPNRGHDALAEWQRLKPDFRLITQNVDGLHQQAGSQDVVELHGRLMKTVCSRTLRDISEEWLAANPGCPPPSPYHPEGLARPGVVWFGEALDAALLNRATQLAADADVFLSIGTSSLVQPAASLAMMARNNGAKVVEINPEATPLTPLAHWVLNEPSAEILPRLVAGIS